MKQNVQKSNEQMYPCYFYASVKDKKEILTLVIS